MSNWSTVILTWSSLEKNHKERLAKITEFMDVGYTRKINDEFYATPHNTDADSVWGDFVVVMKVNAFRPRKEFEWEDNELGEVLDSMTWEYPNEVEIFSKNEDMHVFMITHLCDVRVGHD